MRSAEAAWSETVSSLAGRPVWAGVFERRPESTTTDLQHALAPGSALVEYVVGTDQTAAFVLTNATVRARLLPVGEPELRTRIELLRGLLARREPDDWQPVAERLDAELIDPLRQAGWLSGVSRLYIVPHAELNYLPFVVLRHQSPRGARLLVDDVAPVILPAAAALVERGQGAHRGLSRAAFWRSRRQAQDCALPARKSSLSHALFLCLARSVRG